MIVEFWPWMLAKDGRKTGYKLLLNWWLASDVIIALILTFSLKIDAFAFAEKALFPAASILVGMAVAWTARASMIISDKKFQETNVGDENPIEDYVYGYQLSVGIVFASVVVITIMAAGGFDFYIYSPSFSQFLSSITLYSLLSLTIRECWAVINFTNLLSILDSKTK